ncbi:MAG: DUF1573 domain-containing protein [Alphaproteobacteria bacterium]|nr:DUF1573 domain-containing protein [Alphaproteobacteria bacterium]
MSKSKYVIISAAVIIYVAIVGLIVLSKYNNEISKQTIKYHNVASTKISFNDKGYDVGNVGKDTVFTKDYILKNIGEYPLFVKAIYPDCNCTSFETSSYLALPQDSLVISLTVATKNKRIGEFMLHTVVVTNTEEEYSLLKLVGNVVDR